MGVSKFKTAISNTSDNPQSATMQLHSDLPNTSDESLQRDNHLDAVAWAEEFSNHNLGGGGAVEWGYPVVPTGPSQIFMQLLSTHTFALLVLLKPSVRVRQRVAGKSA